MLEKRASVARLVATDLFKFEDALDNTLSHGGLLCSRLMTARQEIELSAVVGQDVVDSLVRALGYLSNARRELVDTHHNLKIVSNFLGFAEEAFGSHAKFEALRVKRTRIHTIAV